jgi:predicted N-formylglutamate amidohydrolase
MRLNFQSTKNCLTLKKKFLYRFIMNALAVEPLLTDADPAPVEVVNAESKAPLLLVCEHAGTTVPAALDGLGVNTEVLDSHRGWDIGAAAVARELAALMGAPLVMQRYSRLVIDGNRPPGGTGSMLAVSDGAVIPSNQALGQADKEARIREIFEPMDKAITGALDASGRRAAFSIHSFTPRLGTVERPWHAGFLSRASLPTARRLMAKVASAEPDLVLAINEPYQIDDETDWFIPVHAERRGLSHSLIEIRNDQIADDAGASHWAELLADAIGDVLEALP